MAESTSTELADVIRGVAIDEFIATHSYGQDLSAVLPWLKRPGKGAGATCAFVREPDLSSSAPTGKVEGIANSFAQIAYQPADAIATPEVLGVSLPITRVGQQDAVPGIPAAALKGALNMLRAQLNQKMLAVITGAGVTAGNDTTECDVAFVAGALQQYEDTCKPESTIVVVLHSAQQWKDFTQDMVTTAARFDSGSVGKFGSAHKGTFMGAEFFVSPHCPAEAAGNGSLSGYIGELGEGLSCLGLAVWEQLKAEIEPRPGQHADEWHVWSRYGCVLARPDKIVELKTRDAAA